MDEALIKGIQADIASGFPQRGRLENQLIAASREGIPHGERLQAALAPMLDGQRLLALKVYYVYKADAGVTDVGAFDLGGDASARFALNLGAFAHAALIHPQIGEVYGFVYVGPKAARWWIATRDCWRRLKAKFA